MDFKFSGQQMETRCQAAAAVVVLFADYEEKLVQESDLNVYFLDSIQLLAYVLVAEWVPIGRVTLLRAVS